MILNRHTPKHKSSGAKFFQPGEPENELEVYTLPTKQQIQYTTEPTSIQITTTDLPLTTLTVTTDTTTTTRMTTILTTTTETIPLTSILMTTQREPTRNINIQGRISSHRRRSNMTLYILTSDEHKIRQFSVNHTRGILINCNQLRRRLLGRRRRLRDIHSLTTLHSLISKNSSNSFQYNILLLTIILLLLFFFLQK